MDQTPKIGHHAVEQDALRVLTVVHQLGEHPLTEQPLTEHPVTEQPAAARRWFVDTESHLQHLDHLVRHPIDLAYVLLDQVRSRGLELETRLTDLARRVRQLLGAARRGHRPALLRPFDPGSWYRWDDALALLGCRGLLEVEPLQGAGTRHELRYRVTADGARWLVEFVYPHQPALEPYRERCRLLRTVLPGHLLRPRSPAVFGAYLRGTGQRLIAFSNDEQLQFGDDLLAHLFQATFAEAL